MLQGILEMLKHTAFAHFTFGNLVMFGVAAALLYVAVKKDAEPLLLVPIAFGIILGNVPPQLTGILNEGGFLWYLNYGVIKGIYPPLIFLGIGALTDFSFIMFFSFSFLV